MLSNIIVRRIEAILMQKLPIGLELHVFGDFCGIRTYSGS